MTKKISIFVIVGLIFTVIAWMIDKTSLVQIQWNGVEHSISLPETMLFVLLFIAIIDVASKIVRKLGRVQIKEVYKSSTASRVKDDESIDMLSTKRGERIVINRAVFDQSLLLVLQAMTSITAGDMTQAHHNIRALKKYIGDDAIIDLLQMKIYKGEKNFNKMEKLSSKLMKNDNVQIVGLKAAVEAQIEKKEFKDALQTANKAFELRQDLYWVIESAFELRAKARDWDGSLQVIEAGKKRKIIPMDRYKRLKAIVLFEMAKEALVKSNEVLFFKCCHQALEAEPTLVPAALALARYYKENDNQFRQSAKVLTKVWKKNPVDDVAYAYLNLFDGENAKERLQRMESFAMLNAIRPSLNNRLVAEIASEAGLWGKAKAEIEIFLINNPCTRIVNKIITKYELEVHKDEKAAQVWKDKHDACAEDSEWVCGSCGALSEEWHAVCPICGAFGQDRWHLYVENFEQDIDFSHDNSDDEE